MNPAARHLDILTFDATSIRERPFDVPLDLIAGPYTAALTADEMLGPDPEGAHEIEAAIERMTDRDLAVKALSALGAAMRGGY